MDAQTARILLILAGVAAFILMTVYDVNNISCGKPVFRSFFFLGAALLSASILGLVIYAYSEFLFFDLFTAIGSLLFIIGLFLQIFALFFAIPFKKTYVTRHPLRVVDTGIYAMCRHPGVWGFILLASGACIAARDIYLTVACIVFTICDLAHVFIQDRFIFPKQLEGYENYRKTTPFLIPNTRSIRAFFATAGRNRTSDT